MEKAKRNRIACFFVVLVLLPLIFLTACGETNSFSVQAYFSSSAGTTSGTGTYEEGSTVTLTATAKTGSFLGWVRDNSLLVSNETYTISNTTSSDDETYVSKSILTFTASSSTQGSYTAVFNDSKMMYVKLSSISFENTSSSSTGEVEEGFAGLNITDIAISEGQNVLENVLSLSDSFTETTLEEAISANNSVLKLSTLTTQYTQFVLLLDDTSATRITLRAGLLFETSNSSSVDAGSGTYTIEYSDGEYEISFTFEIDSITYKMTVIYATLS